MAIKINRGYYFAYRFALLMLVLIRPIKASFIVLLNPILNHLPTADYQQNRFEMILAFR